MIGLRDKLQTMIEEMDGINIRNTPIQPHTKDRWRGVAAEVQEFIVKIVPFENLS